MAKTIRDWFVFVCMLLFLPKDTRLYFEFRPQDWYGELRITTGERLVVIGKNASTGSVRHGITNVTSDVSLQWNQHQGVPSDGRALPSSVTVIEAGRAGNEERHAYLNEEHYFTPGSLSILTRADLYNAYLLFSAIIALFMILGFFIARFGVEEDGLWSTGAPQKEPSQR